MKVKIGKMVESVSDGRNASYTRRICFKIGEEYCIFEKEPRGLDTVIARLLRNRAFWLCRRCFWMRKFFEDKS